jgi:hypothetical protein
MKTKEPAMNHRKVLLISLSSLMLAAPAFLADVKVERRTKLEFPGVLGGIMKTFGGKGAREGIVSKIAVKGDRKMSVNEDTAELVDLAQEKIYQIDMKKKTYTVVTFEEMRRQMQEAMAKAQSGGAAPNRGQKNGEKPPEYKVDVSIKESGQKKNINGYDAREIVTTITTYEKDKKPEDGAMVVTSSTWLAPRIAAMKDMEDFDRRFAQKLLLPFAADMAQQMAPMMAMYPGLKESMGKLDAEKVNMNGTAVLTVIRATGTGNPNANSNQNAQAKPAQENKQETPKSIGGLLGGLGKKAVKKDDKKEETKADGTQTASFMTINEELLSVAPSVAEADVSIPAGFKEKK